MEGEITKTPKIRLQHIRSHTIATLGASSRLVNTKVLSSTTTQLPALWRLDLILTTSPTVAIRQIRICSKVA
jgi:hypothetical protein